MMPVSIEALHPGPSRQKKRGKLGGGPLPPLKERAKKSKAYNVNDPLSQLYAYYAGNKRSLDGAPAALLEKAAKHIAKRIEELEQLCKGRNANAERTTRIRIQVRWLRRWLLLTGGQP